MAGKREAPEGAKGIRNAIEGISNTISEERIVRYLQITAEAMEKVRIASPAPSHLRRAAEDFLSMARAYYQDALHFKGNGDYLNAFAAVNYAHGWLDAGARLGLFDVGGDHRLFTLLE